jgi:hypothetical protein
MLGTLVHPQRGTLRVLQGPKPLSVCLQKTPLSFMGLRGFIWVNRDGEMV